MDLCTLYHKLPLCSISVAEYRVVLLGGSENKKNKLANFIIGCQSFHSQKQPIKQCIATCGEWEGRSVTVVRMPDVLSWPKETMRKVMEQCANLCFPGPNVLLLLVKPSEFDEANRQKLEFVLSLFNHGFKFSLVIVTHKENDTSASVKELINNCEGRHYNMFENNSKLLMQKIDKLVIGNNKTFLTFSEEITRPESEKLKPALNLVLCGSRRTLKTLAAEAILGQREPYSMVTSPWCGEVCGHWVSLVELPDLYEKPQAEVMKESLRCVSLCDPEGIHAFIQVIPVGPLTDDDKGELQTIQNTFGSQVNDFTMILFTEESDPTAPAVVNFVEGDKDIEKLRQSCGGRYVVVNIMDKQDTPKLLEMVNLIIDTEKPRCYTRQTFSYAQIDKIIQQEKTITMQQTEINKLKKNEICKYGGHWGQCF